jgi:DNA-binding NarL/FixJ family response regulator
MPFAAAALFYDSRKEAEEASDYRTRARAMKVLLVDDHVLIRQAMRGVLKKLRRDAVLIEASTGADAMRIVAEQPDIDLVLLDLALPDRNGFSAFVELRERSPTLGIVVLSATQDPANVRRALDLGARGYIPKSAEGAVIMNALRLILSGGTFIPPEILAADDPSSQIRSQKNLGLSDRQVEVLALMMQGKNNKTICRTLNLAEPTVKNNVSAILRALNASSRTEAVIIANNMGWQFPAVPKR